MIFSALNSKDFLMDDILLKIMKKGDVKSVFIILISVIIFIAITIFGFKSISDVTKTMSDAKNKNSYDDLLNEMMRVRASYAEVKSFDIYSSTISKICFYDYNYFEGKNESEIMSKINDILVYDAVKTDSGNIFLFEKNELYNLDFIPGITIEDGYLCVDNKNDKISLILEGRRNAKLGIYASK